MEGHNELLLINYLDRTLEEREIREVEALINSDPEARQQWQYLQLAVEAVEYAALYEQVAAVKENYKTIKPAAVLREVTKKGLITRLHPVVRIAALFILVASSIGSWKYFATNATQVYEKAFIPYTLPTTRGQATITDLEQAYRNKNWLAVIAKLNTSSLSDNKALFLAGMAHLQLQHFTESGVLFEQICVNNTQTGDDYFLDEAQFYWAMSELKGHHISKAISLLQQIRSNKRHLYHDQAARIGNMDLQILKMKANR